MKTVTILLFFGTLTASTPVRKDEKAFSLFSLVSFPNEECTTNLETEPSTSGLCLTGSECSDAGGTSEGNCASSFGVCCFISVSATDSVISNNITYIQNEEYPNPYGDIANTPARVWRYALEGNAGICQFRLDFEDVVLHQPDAVAGSLGTCGGNGDTLTIENPTATFAGFNNLCGILSGQHIYIHYSIDTNFDTVENVNVVLNIGSNTFERHWKIKTSRIMCGSSDKAEEGCLQWFLGLGGRVQSFNYQLATTKIMISNLLYNVCIRKEEGMCGMEVSQTRNDAIAGTSFNLQDGNCNTEFIEVDGNKHCGTGLAGTLSSTLPLQITVGANNAARIANTGFDLTFSQTPCNP